MIYPSRLLAATFTFVLALSPALGIPSRWFIPQGAHGTPQPARPLSMIQLIANPAVYDGRTISVIGFFYLAHVAEGDSLAPHKSDADHALDQNQIHVVLLPTQRTSFRCMSMSYVAVTGVFHATPFDSSNLVAGTINPVTQISGWDPYRPRGCASK